MTPPTFTSFDILQIAPRQWRGSSPATQRPPGAVCAGSAPRGAQASLWDGLAGDLT
jgi:hypothetical protein